MSATSADVAYATYMLNWIESLAWPQLAIADDTLPRLRAYWTAAEEVDLEAINERLWAWVDANGGPQPSRDKAMILVRMLICLAAVPNRELEEVGYFEDLLTLYGLPRLRPGRAAEAATAQPAGHDVIAAGKHVVTANKALLAVHGSEIFEAARAKGGPGLEQAQLARRLHTDPLELESVTDALTTLDWVGRLEDGRLVLLANPDEAPLAALGQQLLLAPGQGPPRDQFVHVGVAGVVADALGLQAGPDRRGYDLARLRHHVAEANLLVLLRDRQMRVIAPGEPAERCPGLDRNLSVSFRRETQ